MLERIKALIEKIKGNEEHRHDLADTLHQMAAKLDTLEQQVEALTTALEAHVGVTHDAPTAPAETAAQQVETAVQA